MLGAGARVRTKTAVPRASTDVEKFGGKPQARVLILADICQGKSYVGNIRKFAEICFLGKFPNISYSPTIFAEICLIDFAQIPLSCIPLIQVELQDILGEIPSILRLEEAEI